MDDSSGSMVRGESPPPATAFSVSTGSATGGPADDGAFDGAPFDDGPFDDDLVGLDLDDAGGLLAEIEGRTQVMAR